MDTRGAASRQQELGLALLGLWLVVLLLLFLSVLLCLLNPAFIAQARLWPLPYGYVL